MRRRIKEVKETPAVTSTAGGQRGEQGTELGFRSDRAAKTNRCAADSSLWRLSSIGRLSVIVAVRSDRRATGSSCEPREQGPQHIPLASGLETRSSHDVQQICLTENFLRYLLVYHLFIK